MNAIKAFYQRHRVVILYLAFGCVTTFVGGSVYYLTLLGGRILLGIPADEVTGARYLTLYTAAQLLQWITAVLFAFFTNRWWVFTDAERQGTLRRQFLTFCSGRVLTLILDYVITWRLTLGLCLLIPSWESVALWGKNWNVSELIAKLISAVVVVVSNYFISKIFVFKKKR